MIKKLLITIAVLTTFSQTASANLIVNGSFEDVGTVPEQTDFGGDWWLFTEGTDLPGWMRGMAVGGNPAVTPTYYAEVRDNAHPGSANTAGSTGETNPLSPVDPNTGTNTKFLELGTHAFGGDANQIMNGGVTQVIDSSKLITGAQYTLSFEYAIRPDLSSSTLSGNPDTNDFAVYWNGTLVQTYANLTNTNWLDQGVLPNLTAQAGNNSLTFVALGKNDYYNASIDSVSLVAAVPEPSTYLMFLAGLGLLGFARKKA